ncbi:MAG: hypothetical protein JJ979_02605 [Roseibium sp.]|nr:hypothetical protein [Roseibium sp.]
MSKKVYSADLKVWATAYIVAESEEEAQQIANELSNLTVGLSKHQADIEVSEAMINTDLPKCSLSPVCTVESASAVDEWGG